MTVTTVPVYDAIRQTNGHKVIKAFGLNNGTTLMIAMVTMLTDSRSTSV